MQLGVFLIQSASFIHLVCRCASVTFDQVIPGHVLHPAVNNQDVIKMSDGHWDVIDRTNWMNLISSTLSSVQFRRLYLFGHMAWIYDNIDVKKILVALPLEDWKRLKSESSYYIVQDCTEWPEIRQPHTWCGLEPPTLEAVSMSGTTHCSGADQQWWWWWWWCQLQCVHLTGCVQILESYGKSWHLNFKFSRLGISWNQA